MVSRIKKEYDAIQPELDGIRAIVDARTSRNMTQKELAERTDINQADISKLENYHIFCPVFHPLWNALYS